MVKFHETLSERSVYFRYFHMLKLNQRVAHERLTRICFIDYDREMALVAERRDPASGEREILGVGRLTKLHGAQRGRVRDCHPDESRARGWAASSSSRLKDVARDEQVQHVTADVLVENVEMVRLCQKQGFEVNAKDDDPQVMSVTLELLTSGLFGQNSLVVQIVMPQNDCRGLDAERLKVWIRGAVQGVGFRPFVYRLATELGLAGWVQQLGRGVIIEVGGPAAAPRRLPACGSSASGRPASVIQGVESSRLDAGGLRRLRDPRERGRREDRARPAGHRHLPRLPARTCATPRTGVTATRSPTAPTAGRASPSSRRCPYDRPRTTMAGFAMCPACRAEYEDPRDRRFHAQPNACPACGPHLELVGCAAARCSRRGDEALRRSRARVSAAGQTSSP